MRLPFVDMFKKDQGPVVQRLDEWTDGGDGPTPIKVDPYTSSLAVTACGWVAHGASRAEPVVEGSDILQQLLVRPNPDYGFSELVNRLAMDYNLGGAGASRIIMDEEPGFPSPLRLRHLPIRSLQEPRDADGPWVYTNKDGKVVEIPQDEMLIWANGTSATNRVIGTSPLALLGNPMATDEQGFDAVAHALYNAKFGTMLYVDQDMDEGGIGDDAIADFSRKVKRGWGGGSRGSTAGVNHKVGKVDLMPNFKGLAMTEHHNIAEERVCSAMRIQPSVLGLGTGIQQVRIGATALENRRESWRGGVIPVINSLQETLQIQLADRYFEGARVELSVAQIQELKRTDDEIIELLEAGIISADEARALAGFEGPAPARRPEPEDDPEDEGDNDNA